MISLGAKSYVRAIWFVAGEDADWMGIVLKDDGEHFKGKYRFRCYDGKSKSGDGEANWCTVSSTVSSKGDGDDVRELEAIFDLLAKKNAGFFGGKVQKLEINGDAEKTVDILSKQPWAKEGKALDKHTI